MTPITNAAAERALLGIIINHNQILFEVGSLAASDFRAEPLHGELLLLLKDQIEANRTVTAATLLHDAQDAPIWGDIKASDYLRQLEEEAPPPSHAQELARIVRDTALRARLVEAANGLIQRVQAAPVSIAATELRTEYDEAFAALFSTVDDLGIRPAATVAEESLNRLKSVRTDSGYPLGLAGLEQLTGAFQPGRFYALGGAPGSGKSALALQVARHIAKTAPVVIFSPEMQAAEQAERIMTFDTGISTHKIERNLVDNAEYEALFNAAEAMKGGRLYIDDHSAPTLAMIRGRAMRMKKLTGLALIVIDHCHYMGKPDRRMPDFEALNDNLTGLKQLAKDLSVAVLGLVQFGTEALRDMAKWPHRKPTQGDLLFAGIVDRHADAIVLVHRLETFLRRNQPYDGDKIVMEWKDRLASATGKADLILTKRRGGLGFGEQVVYFDAPRYRFSDNAPKPSRDMLGAW